MSERKLGVSMLVFAISLIMASGATPYESIPEGLIEATEKEVHKFFTEHTREELENCNFLYPGDDIGRIGLGLPYRKYRLEVKKIRDLKHDDSFKESLKFLNWCIPIFFDNQPRTLIEMAFIDGKWDWRGTGGDPIPIVEMRKKFRESDGYQLAYVLSIDSLVYLEFIMVEKNGDLKLFPLREARIYGIERDEGGKLSLISGDKFLEKLKMLHPMKSDPSMTK